MRQRLNDLERKVATPSTRTAGAAIGADSLLATVVAIIGAEVGRG